LNPLTNIILIFPLAITLHNIEEALWLPAWSRHASRFHKPVEKNEFYFALICVTLLAYLSSFLYIFFNSILIVKYVYFGFVSAMVINAIFPHLAATIVLKRYAPGLITGIFLIIPCNSLILYFAVNTGIITVSEIIISTVFTGGIILIMLPVFFKIGRKITVF
jgi:hypothetical protein